MFCMRVTFSGDALRVSHTECPGVFVQVAMHCTVALWLVAATKKRRLCQASPVGAQPTHVTASRERTHTHIPHAWLALQKPTHTLVPPSSATIIVNRQKRHNRSRSCAGRSSCAPFRISSKDNGTYTRHDCSGSCTNFGRMHACTITTDFFRVRASCSRRAQSADPPLTRIVERQLFAVWVFFGGTLVTYAHSAYRTRANTANHLA